MRKVKVTNRSAGEVFYRLNDSKVFRTFNGKETKEIPFSELEELAQQPGGRALIEGYLLIEDEKILSTLDVNPEPEYFLTAEAIPEWLKTCTIDEFTDALEYAPEGVIELIKKIAVEERLNDFSKREALKRIKGFDVTKAIELTQDTEVSQPKETGRRTQPKYKKENTSES